MILARPRPCLPTLVTSLAFLGSLAAATAARAEPADDDEAETARPRDRLMERERSFPEPEASPSAVPRLWLDLEGGLRLGDGRSQVSAGVTVGGSFDELVKPAEVRRAASRAKSYEKRPQTDEPEEERSEPEVERPRRAPLVLDGALARGAVKAALICMKAEERVARFDDLGTRARVSGLVPEVRIRVARVVDEDQTLSPTEYDPGRLTASGGVSFYLEGRASFQLDRLVFADQEIAIERLRADDERTRRERTLDVLGALSRWQQAEAVLTAEHSDDAALARAEVDAAVAAAALDVWTDGWFTKKLPATRYRSTE